MPLTPDLTRRVINVHWGGDAIVVFVDRQNIARSTYNIVEGKATLLEAFPISIDVDTTTAVAYKVQRDAGEFMQTTAPSFNDGGLFTKVGHAIFVFVFAIGASIDGGLARAKVGASLAYESAIKEYSGDQPAEKADPPGLLWSVGSEPCTCFA